MRRKALALCMALWLLPAVALAQQPLVYGRSRQGRDLVCYRVGSETPAQSVLLVFGLHGFEDAYDRDGALLMELANALAKHYDSQPLGTWALYLIPSANPDGLEAGITKDGFGRCNADGIDLNRDFPVGWKQRTGARNLTGAQPLAAAESQALVQLVGQLNPTYAVDVHGWTSRVYGDKRLAKPFMDAFSLPHGADQSGGKLSQWLDSVTQGAVLLELPASPGREGYLERVTARFICALDRILQLEPKQD